jgi:hypothetical protein
MSRDLCGILRWMPVMFLSSACIDPGRTPLDLGEPDFHLPAEVEQFLAEAGATPEQIAEAARLTPPEGVSTDALGEGTASLPVCSRSGSFWRTSCGDTEQIPRGPTPRCSGRS